MNLYVKNQCLRQPIEFTKVESAQAAIGRTEWKSRHKGVYHHFSPGDKKYSNRSHMYRACLMNRTMSS